MRGLAQLHTIGSALLERSAFDEKLSEGLRDSLGDWRKPIEFSFDTIVDPISRTQFYSDLGLDQSLTDFPYEAFEEGTTVAELQTNCIPIAAQYSLHPAFLDSVEDEESLERTKRAFDILFRFETQVRKFVDERMTACCGATWIKHRIPGQMSEKWREKQTKAVSAGQPGGIL